MAEDTITIPCKMYYGRNENGYVFRGGGSMLVGSLDEETANAIDPEGKIPIGEWMESREVKKLYEE